MKALAPYLIGAAITLGGAVFTFGEGLSHLGEVEDGEVLLNGRPP